MILLLTLIAIIYWIRSCIFFFGARTAAHPPRTKGYQPRISVVVAVRNEEGNIGRCIQSLAAQDYPRDKFEIIVMNDGSTDGSAAEIAAEIAKKGESRPMIKVFPVREETTHLRGKALVITQGFEYATGEVLVTTDADCTVLPTWLSTIGSYYEPETASIGGEIPQTGIVAGFTVQTWNSVFSAVQSIDWMYLMTLASAGIGLGKPLGCIGNNLSFRKSAYKSVGGYRGIPFSVTEDLAILAAITGNPRWKCKYPRNGEMIVWSAPCPDVATLWAQKRRWAQGGKKLGAAGYVILAVSALMNLAIVYSLVTLSWAPLCGLLAARWIADFFIVIPTIREFRCMNILKYFMLYEVYALIYESALPFSLLNKKIAWKGRTF